jgi:hypothetical protein
MRHRGAGRVGRNAYAALNVALVIVSFPVGQHVADRLTESASVAPEEIFPPASGLANNGAPVENIYAFSRDGRPLYDVLLYDHLGKPLQIGGPGSPDPDRRLVVTKRGTPLYNAFPIRYYEPGTRKVAHAEAAPRKSAPKVATPPLKR